MDEMKSPSAAASRPPCGDDAASRAYAVIQEALKAYDGHWSYLAGKASGAGASMQDVSGENEYDFIETVKSIAWSYFLYEAQHYFRGNPDPEPYITKDIISTLKRQDKARRRFLDTVWDSRAALEGLPLIKYLDQAGCSPALKAFFTTHFAEGKKLLGECLGPLAKCADEVEGHAYRRIVRTEVWKRAKGVSGTILSIAIVIGIFALQELCHIPPYILMAGLCVFLGVFYIVKREKKILYYICTLSGYLIIFLLLLLLPQNIRTPLGIVSLFTIPITLYLIERKMKQ